MPPCLGSVAHAGKESMFGACLRGALERSANSDLALQQLRKVRPKVARISLLGKSTIYFLTRVQAYLKGDRLILNFSTEEVRDICEKRSVATTALGSNGALELAQVLADIDACGNFSELAAIYSGSIADVNPSEKAIDLPSGCRLTVRSGHPTHPKPPARITDWDQVTRLRIVSIETTNG